MPPEHRKGAGGYTVAAEGKQMGRGGKRPAGRSGEENAAGKVPSVFEEGPLDIRGRSLFRGRTFPIECGNQGREGHFVWGRWLPQKQTFPKRCRHLPHISRIQRPQIAPIVHPNQRSKQCSQGLPDCLRACQRAPENRTLAGKSLIISNLLTRGCIWKCTPVCVTG